MSGQFCIFLKVPQSPTMTSLGNKNVFLLGLVTHRGNKFCLTLQGSIYIYVPSLKYHKTKRIFKKLPVDLSAIKGSQAHN